MTVARPTPFQTSTSATESSAKRRIGQPARALDAEEREASR